MALTALALVYGLAHLFGGTGSTPTAGVVSATPAPSASASSSVASAPYGPVVPAPVLRHHAQVPLAAPTGPCADDQVSVRPSAPRAYAGQTITVRLDLQGTQPACTYSVSDSTVAVSVVDHQGQPVWSSQDCPGSIPARQVVVRSAVATRTTLQWNGHRSDVGCPGGMPWVMPGLYRVQAAVLGSTPFDAPFAVTLAPVATRTAKPRVRPSATPSPSTAPASAHPSTAPAKRHASTAPGSARPSH